MPVPVPLPFPAPGPATGPATAQTPAQPRLPSVPHTPPSPSVSLAPPFPATEWGVSVARACYAAPLGDGTGQKCSPSVRRGAVRQRNGAEMFPERAARPPWATELGGSVPRACVVVLLGDGTGPKCSPSVKCGHLGRRKAAKPSPGRVWKRSRVAASI